MAINFDHTNNIIETPDGSISSFKGKNAIINGNFDIWQRGTSFVSPSSGDYIADRFRWAGVNAAVVTCSRGTSVPTYAQSGVKSNYCLNVVVTTADASVAATDRASYQYYVEGYDYARIAGGNATLSFWVTSAKTGTHCVAFRNSGLDRSYVAEYTVNVADTWEKKTITVPLTETGGTWDYTNGRGLQIAWTLIAGSTYQTTADTWATGDYFGTSNQVNVLDTISNTFRIAQVQLEKGDTATPFEFRHVHEELALCKRYYEIVRPTARWAPYLAARWMDVPVDFVTKRTTPSTALVTAGTRSNVSSVTLVVTSTSGARFEIQNTAADDAYALIDVWELDAEL